MLGYLLDHILLCLIVLHDREGHSISTKSTSSANPMKIISEVRYMESNVTNEWYLEVDNKINFGNINSSRQNIGAD